MAIDQALAALSLCSPPPAPSPPPHAVRALASSLPPEIVLAILDHLSQSASGELLAFTLTPETALSQRPGARHSATLRPLALVCRAWHVPACEVLYRDLTVFRPGQLPALVRQSRRCLPCVRHLRVLWNRQPWIMPQDPDLALIPELLDLCPCVDRVTLAGEQFDLSSPALLDSLRKRSSAASLSSPIRRLSCCAIETPFFHQRQGPQGRRTSETISALLLSCPDLIEGRWDEFKSTFSLMPALPDARLAPRLEKVAFQRVALESVNLERMLCPLGGQLRELYLDRTSLASLENWRTILGQVGERLEVLELKDCDLWATWEVSPTSPALIDATLSACPLLRYLVLLGSLDSLAPKFERTHDALESFTIGCRAVEPGALARAVRRGAFPALKKLHVEATCEWTDAGEAAVQAACVAKGVKWETGWNLD